MNTLPLPEAKLEIERSLDIRISAITPDAIADALGLWGSESWQRLSPHADEHDSVVWGRIRANLADGGRILVVTDLCFMNGRGAFVLEDSSIEDFVASYEERLGESFFNGDVVVVGLDARQVWLLHHEEMYVVHTAEGSMP